MLKRYLLAPGPTPVPPEVLLAMARPMIHHRAPEFDKLFAEVREDLMPALLRKAGELGGAGVPALVAAARATMAAQLDREIARLEHLRRVNPSVRAEEINLLRAQKADLDRHLAAARLRLDAIRLIRRGPE